MKQFFLNMNNSSLVFKAFNILHVISLIIVFILFIAIIYNKKKLNDISDTNKKQIRIIFGIILIIFYALRRGTYIYYGVYSWRSHLSLGFCNMTNLLFIIYCFTGDKKVFNLCYYCAFCGPLLSILIPVINTSINNYSFINFIMIHHVLFLMNMVFAIFERKKHFLKDMFIAYGFMIIYILACYVFNLIFGTQYNFLNQFIIDGIQNSEFILFIISSKLMNFVVLLFIGILMILIGRYILKLLNERRRINEQEVI